MSESQEIMHNAPIIRFLQLLDFLHPDPNGTILIHGNTEDTAAYIRIVHALDFKAAHSQNKEEFRMHIKNTPNILFVMLVSDEICHSIRSDLMYICRNREPIYVLYMTIKEGDIPNSDQRHRTIIFHKNVDPEDAAVGQMIWKTIDLFKKANDHIVNHAPVPDYPQNG